MNRTIKKENGFTIIEVVLVLAIAALIKLHVIMALPALQRGQRDTQRKNDVSRLQAAVSNYKARNKGRIPDGQAAWNSFFSTDLRTADDTFADPTGDDYVPKLMSNNTAAPAFKDDDPKNMYIYVGARCNGETVQGNVASNARKVVIVKPLEGGGQLCQEA